MLNICLIGNCNFEKHHFFFLKVRKYIFYIACQMLYSGEEEGVKNSKLNLKKK